MAVPVVFVWGVRPIFEIPGMDKSKAPTDSQPPSREGGFLFYSRDYRTAILFTYYSQTVANKISSYDSAL
jgi:hypothetical protein